MNRHMTWAGAVALAALAWAGTASANEPDLPRGQRVFDRLDSNKDGALEVYEVKTRADRRLALADANGDKVVTAAEIDEMLMKRISKRRARIMETLDADRNGSITAEELDRVVQDMFNGADADKSGGLTMTEIRSFSRAKWRKAFLSQLDTDTTKN